MLFTAICRLLVFHKCLKAHTYLLNPKKMTRSNFGNHIYIYIKIYNLKSILIIKVKKFAPMTWGPGSTIVWCHSEFVRIT